MICLICRKAELLEGLVSMDMERGEFKTVINLVPAQVCPACGEAYLNEEVAAHILNQVEALAHEGMSDVFQDYA
jgi:YgiT-type zinc finger domain-containing protein